MEERSASEYCPKCQLVQPTFEFTEDSRTVRRCTMCGFPVKSGLVLESAEALGLPSPPDVKILCVDDDPIILQLNGDILRFHGYTVLTALDGPTALEMAARERPALVLLDIMMPDMDGFAVCRRLKADPALKAIPIIVLTAMTDPKLNVRAFDAGAELALRKPAEPAVVLRTVEAALALAAAKVGESPLAAAPGPVIESAGPEPADRESEAQAELAIPVRPVPLTVWTIDGAKLDGRVFLRLYVEAHAGPETVQDRLNDPDLFLAVSLPGDTPLIFLNKIQVIRVDVSEEEERLLQVPESLVGVSIEPIRVQLINGEHLSGTVRIEGPTGKRRLSDFLNTQPAFLPLKGPDRLHFLHKRFIARVLPRGS
ncbi:MAG: response regulator [Candidatus Methylomirabilales bacterium]